MEGFTLPEVQTAIVNGEGTTVVRYFYKRNVHRLTLVLDNGQDDVVYDYMYGTKIDVINPEKNRIYIYRLEWNRNYRSK